MLLAVVKVERAARKTPVGQEKNLVHFSRILSNNFGSINHNFSLIKHKRRIILPDGREKRNRDASFIALHFKCARERGIEDQTIDN
jgi:hypothetical protein